MSTSVTTLRNAGLRAVRSTGWRIRGPWGLPIFFAALAIVGTGESLRLILGGPTSEARAGGWYLLMVSALIAIGARARPDRATARPPTEAATVDPAEPESSPDGAPERTGPAREAAIFFVAAFIFAWALPWFGFTLANGLFVAAYLRWVDHRRWWHAVLIASVVDACLVIGLKLIDVALPTGVFGIGF